MLVLICGTVILEKTIRIPRSLSVKAAQVLKGFLNKVYTYTIYKFDLSHDHSEDLISAYHIMTMSSPLSLPSTHPPMNTYMYI